MVTIILNEPPYGTEKSYNGLRLATSLQKREEKVSLFLMADSAFCALKNQETPNGYYNIGRMIRQFLNKGGQISACGSCMEARGLTTNNFIEGVVKGNMEQLTDWVLQSEKVINY